MRDRIFCLAGGEMIITINEVPLSKNKYINMHWSKRVNYKKVIAWLIYEKTYLEEIHAGYPNSKYPLNKATITFNIYFKTKRRRDVQNYLGGGLIAWLDALVDQQIINDDCYDCIGQPLVTFNIDKINPRTEIVIRIIV